MSYEASVRRVVPYVPGEQPNRPDMIKLNTNECPYPPSPRVEEALRGLDADSMRLYPDPAASSLIQALAARYRVEPEQVFVGVGSDDVLALSFLTFFNSEKPVLFPDITYSFYDVWADLFRIPFQTCPLREDFTICAEDYLKPNGGIVIPNPNAPTGLLMPLAELEKIIAANPDSVVIIDEAYVDFGAKSVLPLVEQYENLLVVQTFSKSRAMAGARIGFAIGQPKLIAYLNDVKFSFNSYTMSQASLAVGRAAVEDEAYFQEITGRIIKTREQAKKELRALGFSFPDSKANFIFATHERMSAKEIFDRLRERDIYVRYFNKPRIDNYLRITVGTDEQMEALFAALREIVGQGTAL
ncbi:MAG: histidinol-phosphate transaminase [Lachnospiraceae bacterium]|nr:histidinol-phosphate transaminase [Lachnospiraceae bacterium]